jgi:hypothetical protein
VTTTRFINVLAIPAEASPARQGPDYRRPRHSCLSIAARRKAKTRPDPSLTPGSTDPKSFGGGSFFEKLHRIADGHDRLRLIVRDFNAELFLKSHDKLNRVERIGAKVVNEIGVIDHLVGFNAQMLDNNLLYALSDIAHFVRPHTGGARGPAFD